MHSLTVQVQDEADDRAALVLVGLADTGHLPRFLDAIDERRDLWTVLCWLEDDLLNFTGGNRWCGALDGWRFVVGHCPSLSENVPEWLGYGKGVQAWLEFEDEWALTIVPPNGRQYEDTNDVLVWSLDAFTDEKAARQLASVAFADDSAIHLNRAMREIRELDAMLGGSSG